jgi:hypothetical protein
MQASRRVGMQTAAIRPAVHAEGVTAPRRDVDAAEVSVDRMGPTAAVTVTLQPAARAGMIKGS